jgi:DNA primase
VICPDADTSGQTHATKVFDSVTPYARETRLVEWKVEDFSNGGKDVSDFMNDHTVNELSQKFGKDWIRENE